MMGTKIRSFSPLPDDLSLEDLVPQDHFYRRLEATLDLSFVMDLVEPLYARGGRSSVDPVVFFKLQLIMFFEDLRNERQLIRVVSDRLSLRWYLGYDLQEPLPDHSSLTPRWFVEAYLRKLFDDDGAGHAKRSAQDPSDTHDVRRLEDERPVHFLSTAANEVLHRSNSANEDWISRSGAQDRAFKGTAPRERTAGTRVSRTDPDATPMRLSVNARRLGYRTNYIVDGDKARVILPVLVTPGEVSENRPMLDLLWRTAFRSSPRTTRRTKVFNTLAR